MMASQLVTWILATATAMIVPRFLGPAVLGELRLGASLWTIAATVTALGTSMFLQLEIARSQREGLDLAATVLVLRTIAFAACAVVLGAYVASTTNSDRFIIIWAMLGIGTLLSAWSDVFATTFLGLEKMSVTAFVAAMTKFATFVAVVVVLLMTGSVYALVVVQLVVGLFGLIYIAQRFRRLARLDFAGWRSRAIPVFRRSITFMAAGVALVFYQQIDMVVISWVAENEDLGWYGAADVLFGSLLFPATVVTAALLPTMGRLFKEDHEALDGLVRRTFSILTLLAVPIGFGTVIVASDFAPLLFGEDFAETGTVLAVLGPVIILTFGTILFGTTALATERGRFWVFVMFGAALLTIPLDLMLVPWSNDRWGNGAIGGALAYVVTETFQFVLGVCFVVPFLVTKQTIWRSFKILGAGFVMLAAGWTLRATPMLVTIAACALVYVVLILALRVLGTDEREALGALAGRLGLRVR